MVQRMAGNIKKYRRICPAFVCFYALLCFVSACTAHRARQTERMVRRSSVFDAAFTGFVLMDAATGRIWCDNHGDKYFTPASNTKTLTLAAALANLGDTLPAFRYATAGDTLYVVPTGNPAFLHPDFAVWQRGFQFLKRHPAAHIVVCDPAPALVPYGPGWMWDDLSSESAPERSTLPVFGNMRLLRPATADSLCAAPHYWNRFLKKTSADSAQVLPEWQNNLIRYDRRARFPPDYEAWVPVHDTRMYNRLLLADTLGRPLSFMERVPDKLSWKTWRDVPSDTVYRKLMYQSDNFLAEQLLLMSAVAATGKWDAAAMIQKMKEGPFAALSQPVVWTDGSGLSRYNLLTPQSNAQILRQLWQAQPQQRLLSIFPAGGVSGTIASWYGNEITGQGPFVFAKTGTMTAVHCLSGYLITRKGRVLIFSFMHNNFRGSSKGYKEEMQRILRSIRDKW